MSDTIAYIECPQCRRMIESHARFCRQCGLEINAQVRTIRQQPTSVPNNSGTGATAQIPAEIITFNFGAFVFTWLWAMSNNVWIGVVALVPFLISTNKEYALGADIAVILTAFVLGIKGNVWAWQFHRWDSVDHFKRVQKIWSVTAITYLGICGLLIGIFYAVAFRIASNAVTDMETTKDRIVQPETPSTGTGAPSYQPQSMQPDDGSPPPPQDDPSP